MASAPPPARIRTPRLVIRCWEPTGRPAAQGRGRLERRAPPPVDAVGSRRAVAAGGADRAPARLSRRLPRRSQLRLRRLLGQTRARWSAAPGSTIAWGRAGSRSGTGSEPLAWVSGFATEVDRRPHGGGLHDLRRRSGRAPHRSRERGKPADPGEARLRRGGAAQAKTATVPRPRRAARCGDPHAVRRCVPAVPRRRSASSRSPS